MSNEILIPGPVMDLVRDNRLEGAISHPSTGRRANVIEVWRQREQFAKAINDPDLEKHSKSLLSFLEDGRSDTIKVCAIVQSGAAIFWDEDQGKAFLSPRKT